MASIRVRLGIILAWFFLFFNVERIHEPLNIASFVYAFAALSAIAIVSLRPLPKLSLVWLNGVALALYLVLKKSLGYPIAGSNLTITVTELCAIGVTVALACELASVISRFEKGATEIMTIERMARATGDGGNAGIHRELRRARQFERPLAVVALASKNGSDGVSIGRVVQAIQREMADKYVNALLTEMLAEQTHDYDLVTRCNDHFILLLPETDATRAQFVIERVRKMAREKLHLDLAAGTAEFPSEETTLSGLLERAETRLRSKLPGGKIGKRIVQPDRRRWSVRESPEDTSSSDRVAPKPEAADAS